jgi:hypothetical protein
MKRTLFTTLVLSAVISGFSPATFAAEDDDSMRAWQMSLLYEPSPAQRRVEDRGRVVIYDGLHSTDIDRAFEEQFERVENMMFVNTVITDSQGVPVTDPDTGEYLTEDDGC